MALVKASFGKGKPTKHVIQPTAEQAALVYTFIKDCIKNVYDCVFVHIAQEYFELQILDGKLTFITDDNLKTILDAFIKTKTSVGSVLTHLFSIDRIDKTIVKTIGSNIESVGYVFKIKWNKELQQLHIDEHPEMWDLGNVKNTIPDAE